MKLASKIAIVAGGSSGIGRAIAIRFAREGAKAVLADIDREGAQHTLSRIEGGSVFIETDVRNEDAVKKLIAETVARFGTLDIAVHSIGIYSPREADITTLPLQEVTRVMNTNFTSAFLLAKHALPHLLPSKGTMINIASSLGVVPEEESHIYCSSKAAMIMLTKTTALRYAKTGVRINCICPGPIDTPLLHRAYANEEELQEYIKRNPMGRMGTPDEVANLALFLASSESSYMTGGVYTVDGGEALA